MHLNCVGKTCENDMKKNVDLVCLTVANCWFDSIKFSKCVKLLSAL